jgi:protein SCO1/2
MAVLAALSLHQDTKSQTLEDKPPEAEGTRVSFRFASSNGGYVDSKELKGKPYGLFFGFAHCPDICPTTLSEVSKTLSELGPAAKDFRMFFVTVDPERDTAPMLEQYMANFDPRIEALVPTFDELAQISKTFDATYKKIPTSDGDYTMGHTITVYLMDREGKLHSVTSFGELPEKRLAKVQKLLSSK